MYKEDDLRLPDDFFTKLITIKKNEESQDDMIPFKWDDNDCYGDVIITTCNNKN